MRGVRWLGPTARIASFSSDKAQHGQAFRNALVITDVRSRSSLAFRWASDHGVDSALPAELQTCALSGRVQAEGHHVKCQQCGGWAMTSCNALLITTVRTCSSLAFRLPSILYAHVAVSR